MFNLKSIYPDAKISTETDPYLTAKERERFPWGRIIAIHEIGDYTIFEYLQLTLEGHHITSRISDKRGFHVDKTSHTYPSLDAALIGAIGYKYDGPSSQAAIFFGRMIGLT